MGTDAIINALHMESAHVVKGTNTDTINEKTGHNNKMREVLEAHQSEESKILSNESLSPQGKADALKKLGTAETAPALKWLQPVITRKQDTDQRYRTQFFTINSGIADPAERMPKFLYLWGKLDTGDQSSRVTTFISASEKDEVVVLSAMLENPLGAMIPADVKTAALTERATRLFPQQYENFKQNQILLEYLTMVRDWIARWLFNEVRVEIPIIRTNLGDEIADVLQQQTTGLPVSK